MKFNIFVVLAAFPNIMGNAAPKKDKHLRFNEFTVVTGRKGKPRGLWNLTTYDIIPSTSTKYENRV